ncbi:MAG: glycosyltransferase family 4 protein [Ruminococcus sp.]|nr:glycosyltransferase family 4 protein [Ruminococcus sp.]
MRENQSENIVIADCDASEVLSLAKSLTYKNQSFTVKSHISNFERTNKFSEIKRYAIYFFVGLKYFLTRKKYNAIIGWQQFYALIYSFFCSLFGVKKCNTVVALNFTYKEKNGKAQKLYKWFMKKCLSVKYLDYLHVLSYDYADIISCEFGFPRERIIVTSFGIDDMYDELSCLDVPQGLSKESFALAIGRSNRDYDFLIKAWKDIDYPLVIISDKYKKKGELPKQVTLISNVTGEESYPYIANCSLMVIPIDDGSICSGDTVLLTAMSLKRKIIVTSPSTLAEMYVVDKENALLAQKDEQDFINTVISALHSKEYKHLGDNARESFVKNFSRQSMGAVISDFINKNAS